MGGMTYYVSPVFEPPAILRKYDEQEKVLNGVLFSFFAEFCARAKGK